MSLTREPAAFAALMENLRDFIVSQAIPNEDLRQAHDGQAMSRTVLRLRAIAVQRGLGAPRAPLAQGGLALSWEECCAFFEEAGRSFLGPPALQCAPPGQPDIAALERLANPLQRQRFLDPLVRGESHSCFAMTEPAPGAGSDPRMLQTTARRDGQGWVIDGSKWFISGVRRADFAIVVARTEAGPSWFLVERGTPGFEVVRDIPTMVPFDFGGGHGELRLTACKVGPEALVGEEGRGLDYAQIRLEGARLFHCMRYVGLASRAMSVAQEYASGRQSHGAALAEHQMVQTLVADAHIDLHAARLMTLDVARRLDRGEPIRHESSMTKVFVSEAVCRVADSAVQITGALGISEDVPLSMILRMLRPFRIYDGASEVHRAAIAKRVFRQRLRA